MTRGEGLMKRSTAFKTTAALLAVFALLPLFAACNKTAKAEYFDIFGTTAYIETYDADDAEKTESGMRRVEELCSVNIEGSDIWRINAAHAGETVTVDEITMLLLTRAMSVYELTDGCYDPTVYPLVKLWGFAAGDFVAGTPPEGGIPTDEEISAALALVGFDRVFSLNASECTVTKLIEGAKLDLGGIAKGYASSLAFSVSFDICNVGGNLAVGMPAATIGVPAPRETETVSSSWLFSFKAAYGQCVSTSGDYCERDGHLDGRSICRRIRHRRHSGRQGRGGEMDVRRGQHLGVRPRDRHREQRSDLVRSRTDICLTEKRRRMTRVASFRSGRQRDIFLTNESVYPAFLKDKHRSAAL